MKNEEYWEDAALRREIAVQEGATATIEEIAEMYERARKDIETEIKTIKRNFEKRYGIDETKAAYFLSRAQRENNLEMLVEALQSAPDDDARQKILDYIQLDGLSVRAYAARTERFQALETAIYARLKKLAADETKTLKTALNAAYKEGYYGFIDDYAKGSNIGVSFTVIDDAAVDEVIGAKWHGARFSERIWKETDRLADEAREIAARYITSGRSLTKAARELRESFQVSEYHAATLIHTEVAHAHAKADLKAYDNLGIEKYRYLATLDYRTCEKCGALDGMTFNVSDAKEGVNYPVMHPRCRCTTTIDMKHTRRSMRDPITGKSGYTDKDMTYKEWRESLTPEQDKALKLSQKKDARKTADKAQYGKYKHVLGTENLPKSFDKFQTMKYTDKERYSFIKLDYSRQKRLIDHPELALPNAANATADNRKFTEYLFGGKNEKGLAKGRAITSRLGYDIDNYQEFKQEILSRAIKYPTVHKGNNGYGEKYEQKIVIYGTKEKPANVVVGWLVNDSNVNMTSAYIKEVKQQ